MRIKLFFVASFVYIALVFVLAWYLKLGNYTLNFSTYTFELPVMIWLILPLCFYAIFTILHMSFYGFLQYLKFKNFFKDSYKFELFTQDLLLEKNSKISFQTKEFRAVAELFKLLKTHKKNSNFPKINEILDLIDGLNKNEFVNLNKFKLENENILFLQNEKNHLKNDVKYAFSRLKNLDELKNELDEIAFENIIEKGSYEQIKSLKIHKNQSQVLKLIKRFKEGNLELNAAEYEILLSHNTLDENAYLSVAKMSLKLLNPDAILGIFSKLKNEKSEALRAYLYLLAEFALLDELRKQIHNDNGKFSDFKAFLVLREKNIKIDLNKLLQ